MKKGFTLIELLAVIVILAIIALIAIPVIMSIIEGSQKEANERSIDMYAKAAQNAIAKYEMRNNGQAPKSFDDIKDLIEYDGTTISCEKQLINTDGTIYLEGCTIGNTKVEGYTYGTIKDAIVTPEQVEKICTPVTGDDLNYKYVYVENWNDFILGEGIYTTGTKSEGDAYRCQVNDTQSYIFNIIGQDASGNYNLLLNHNLGYADITTVDTVVSSLFSLTDSWTKLDPRTDSYSGEFTAYSNIDGTELNYQYTFNYTGHYARFIEYSELKKYAEGTYSAWDENSKPWISSVPKDKQTTSNVDSAWMYISSEVAGGNHIVSENRVSPNGFGSLGSGVAATYFEATGIRPVITVPEGAIQ